MRILYAVQKTGNGHLARAQEIIPLLQIYGDVDILTSGSQSQINLGFPVTYDFKNVFQEQLLEISISNFKAQRL